MNGFFALAAAASLAATHAPTELTVEVDHLRTHKGVIHLCLTRQPAHFPDCKKDPAALRRTIPATAPTTKFIGFVPGAYALTLFHDENNNQRLDTVLGVPREGFGFSRNPKIRMGAPKFREVVVHLRPGMSHQSIRLQYLL